MRVLDYFSVALYTTVNIVLNGATLGQDVGLEGRVNRVVFTNWARRFRYAPRSSGGPTTEQEIVELIRDARCVKVRPAAPDWVIQTCRGQPRRS